MLLTAFFSPLTYGKRLFIIDTDVGIDDVIAIMYFLKRPDIDIKAITIVNGEAHCKPAYHNVKKLLRLFNRKDLPLACGRDTPLAGNHKFPDFIRKEADTLAGAALFSLNAHQDVNKTSAVNLITATLKTSPVPIDILAIGPLTNIAEVLLRAPALKNKIRMIYIMGGAVGVKGNIIDLYKSSKNTMAEFNIYVDPKAGDIVFRSEIPITLIPLDITNQMPVTMKFYETAKQHNHNAISQFLFRLYDHNKEEIRTGIWYFWDTLAASIASDDTLADSSIKKLRVIVGKTEAGATIVDNQLGNYIRVCTKLKNKKKFEQNLLYTIRS